MSHGGTRDGGDLGAYREAATLRRVYERRVSALFYSRPTMTVVSRRPSSSSLSVGNLGMTVLNNEQLEQQLHVVCCISNPCGYHRRFELAKEFCARMRRHPSVLLYVVELAYAGQDFHVTDSSDQAHWQLRADDTPPLWHKENLINMAVRKLLPESWKAFAWIDADVEFLSPHWASDALRLLNGASDVVQLWSHAMDLDARGSTMHVYSSFCFRACEYDLRYGKGSHNYANPGFAWAMTRLAFERTGGLYERGILGAGDHYMSLAFVGRAKEAINSKQHSGYLESLLQYERRARGLRLGYVPGVLRHFFHGPKKARGYNDRWKILVKHAYNPSAHVVARADGLLLPSATCPRGLTDDIVQYFAQRDEDAGLREALLLPTDEEQHPTFAR